MLSIKDGIKAFGEFGIIIMDQEEKAWGAFFQVPDDLTRLLVHPGRGGMRGATPYPQITSSNL